LRTAELPAQVEPENVNALAELLDRASDYARASKSAATLRAYDSSWRAFVAWCRVHGAEPLPTAPATVAAYLADIAERVVPTSVTRCCIAISQAHQLRKLPDPTRDAAVKAVLRGIRRQHGRPAVGKDPLLVGDLISIVRALDVTTMAGLRDRALLLLGFSAALRRSELVALDVGDLDFRSDGLAVMLKKSKTDQEARGRVIGVSYGSNGTCPVVAVRTWLTTATVSSGPVIRAVDRHDVIRDGRLSDKAVCRIVKKLVPLAGLPHERYGGHSLRAGFCTSAASAGVEEREIAMVTGHASLVVLRRYIRSGKLFDGELVRRMGL